MYGLQMRMVDPYACGTLNVVVDPRVRGTCPYRSVLSVSIIEIVLSPSIIEILEQSITQTK